MITVTRTTSNNCSLFLVTDGKAGTALARLVLDAVRMYATMDAENGLALNKAYDLLDLKDEGSAYIKIEA